jgi:hypothetical protein
MVNVLLTYLLLQIWCKYVFRADNQLHKMNGMQIDLIFRNSNYKSYVRHKEKRH